MRTFIFLVAVAAAGACLLSGCHASKPAPPQQSVVSAAQIQRNPNLTAQEKARAQFFLRQGPQSAPSSVAK